MVTSKAHKTVSPFEDQIKLFTLSVIYHIEVGWWLSPATIIFKFIVQTPKPLSNGPSLVVYSQFVFVPI